MVKDILRESKQNVRSDRKICSGMKKFKTKAKRVAYEFGKFVRMVKTKYTYNMAKN